MIHATKQKTLDNNSRYWYSGSIFVTLPYYGMIPLKTIAATPDKIKRDSILKKWCDHYKTQSNLDILNKCVDLWHFNMQSEKYKMCKNELTK